MRKKTWSLILTVLIILIASAVSVYKGYFLSIAAGKQPSITGTWKNSIGGQEQVIVLSETELKETIKGAGMPPNGIVMIKKVALIKPKSDTASGIIVTGPAEDLMKPYEVYHWYALEKNKVKFYIGGQQFDTVKDAAKSAGQPEYGRVYNRIK